MSNSGVSRNYPDGNGKLLRFEYGEHDETVVTQRTPQNAYLLLDSQDRYLLNRDGSYEAKPETNPNNIYISHQKLNGFGEIKRVYVSDIYFPWRTPNINIRNNIFQLRINNVDYYMTVPEDFYKPSELALLMQTKANSVTGFQTIASQSGPPVYSNVGQPWTIITDAIGRFIITATGATFTTKTLTDVNGYESYINQVINFFTPPAVDPLPAPVVATFKGGIPSMAYTRYIDFVSTNLTKHQRLKDSLTQFNYTNIIYRLYLENENQLPLIDDTYFGSRPSDMYRQITNPKTIMWNKNEMISAVDIQLYDDAGDPLYIPFQEWEANYLLTIQLSES
jgi:hypothetical protein